MMLLKRVSAIAFMTAAFLIVLSACAIVTEQLTPVPTPPNLIGKWKGEWGGNMVHPIEMVVEKQEGGKVSGTMTIPQGSYPMSGTIGAKADGSLWAIFAVVGPSTWDFPLKVISEKRLQGTGSSKHHYGPVTLMRE